MEGVEKDKRDRKGYKGRRIEKDKRRIKNG